MANPTAIPSTAPMQRPAPLVHAIQAAIAVPKCYGVCCHLHGSCAAYARVEGSDPHMPALEHCGPEYRLYEAVVPA